MLIKGEKYACEACVRGHRVSNCQHADRPLQHVNKKGRPVSQCAHCRTLRKSRSAHVRCECGDKAHGRAASSSDGEGQETCCCSHGTRCTCSLKKEHLDPVPESDSDGHSSSSLPASKARRPRALTAQSEGGLTVFSNGHHKPIHKHNNMAHKCGLPYVVPRANSVHGTSPSGLTNRSVDNLPHTNTIDALHGSSHIKDSMLSAKNEQRMAKSEHGSPRTSAATNLDQLNGLLPPLDLSSLAADYALLQYPENSCLAAKDVDQSLFSSGLSSTSIDWSHYDGLDFNNDFGTATYSQAPSFTGFDFGGPEQPALTATSTSGEISEVEDFGPFHDGAAGSGARFAGNAGNAGNHLGSDFDASEFGENLDSYRLSTASSYVGLPQAQVLASNNIDAIDMETFMKSAAPLASGHVSPLSHEPVVYQDSKSTPEQAMLDESAFVMPVPGDDDTYWMTDFPSNSTPLDSNSSMLNDPFWAQ